MASFWIWRTTKKNEIVSRFSHLFQGRNYLAYNLSTSPLAGGSDSAGATLALRNPCLLPLKEEGGRLLPIQHFIKVAKGLACVSRPPCHDCCPTNQIRIGITTYLKSALSGTVISADELASPRAMLMLSPLRLFSTSSR